MEEPSPEFIAASYVAQLAPLLFDASDEAQNVGDEPQHVAVAEETVSAHLKRQDLDIGRKVATVHRVEDGVKIEYEGHTVTITFDDE